MPLRVVTLVGSVARETELAAELAADPSFELAFRCHDRVELLASLRAGGVEAVVSVGVAAWVDYQCTEEARSGGVRLYGLAADPVEADLLEVVGFEVVRDLTHLRELHLPASPPQTSRVAPSSSGKLIGLWGPKGAPGRTTIAMELATVLARSEPSTLLIDADPYGGDVAQLFGVTEELAGLVSICRSGARGELRDDAWIQQLRRVEGGPVLLPGLLRPQLWTEVSQFGWAELMSAVRTHFSNTVVDVGFCVEASRAAHEGPGRNDVAISTLEEADRIVAVLRADPVGIRSFLWALTDHRELLDGDRIAVVANRVRPGEETEIIRFIRRHLGRPPLVLVPDRPDHVVPAVWQGAPIVSTQPSSPISSAIRELAAALGGRVEPRGFLTRLAGRRVHV